MTKSERNQIIKWASTLSLMKNSKVNTMILYMIV